jgi:hypothetical protein
MYTGTNKFSKHTCYTRLRSAGIAHVYVANDNSHPQLHYKNIFKKWNTTEKSTEDFVTEVQVI